MKNTETYTVVSDPGVDDIIALLLLLKLSARGGHTLVSTFGNAPEEYTAQNAKEFISFAAPHWFFESGPKNPVKPLEHPWPSYFHGEDGVCGIHPAVDVSGVKTQAASGAAKSIISIGPMTGVGAMLRRGNIENITVMGGAIHVPGNETSHAETNIAFDPEAAEYVFAHFGGAGINVVPLDVTKKVFWTKDDVVRIPDNTAHVAWVKKMLLTWFESHGGKRELVFHLHDPLAIYSMYFPGSLEWIISGIQVVTNGVERGRTILSDANPPCKIALEVRNPSRIGQKIFEIIFSA
ncbi:MAG: nucleoside hydrolase [Candidatus Liptonbacteria bacterium]|nr:nucleoside hydrolase [Candidatus Liptonbacteria bacterium]